MTMSSTRRTFLGVAAGALVRAEAAPKRAQIAITFDLEMSRNFPTWDRLEWDYEKGNLDEPTKLYALRAARRVRERGGVMHFFVVGRVLEQKDVGWLREIIAMGHSVGNHTYDHVNLLATRPDQIQPRFARAPWLLRGREPHEFLRENIRMTSEAMRKRLGIDPAGFRTPGGFPQGLSRREDLQRMLMEQRFGWVSGKYAKHPIGPVGEEPSDAVLDDVREVQSMSQPFRYPETNLLEIPMSPVSDINAFRNGRWPLSGFLRAIRAAVEHVIEKKSVYDFLAHPSCLGIVDPRMQSIDLILDMARDAGDRADIADLNTIAAGFGASHA
jgi:hypothetical protein